MFSESVGQTVRVEKCVSNCGAILETSDKASTLLTDVWGVEGGGGYFRLQKRVFRTSAYQHKIFAWSITVIRLILSDPFLILFWFFKMKAKFRFIIFSLIKRYISGQNEYDCSVIDILISSQLSPPSPNV